MDAIDHAFQGVIVDAHRAQRAYNRHGPDAGMLALAALEEASEILRGHLAIDAARREAREVKQ